MNQIEIPIPIKYRGKKKKKGYYWIEMAIVASVDHEKMMSPNTLSCIQVKWLVNAPLTLQLVSIPFNRNTFYNSYHDIVTIM